MTPDPEADDATLVRASQQGDREAFGMLVARHAPPVLGLTRRMLGASADADDVAQETFVAAYRALGHFQQQARFSTWLYRIAINKCHDLLRARRPGVLSLDDTDGDGPVREAADAETPLDQLEQGELAGELERGIRTLTPIYRESFLLRHVEGLGYDEMSAILGVHRDTLKMRVYKARIHLCRCLAHLEGSCR